MVLSKGKHKMYTYSRQLLLQSLSPPAPMPCMPAMRLEAKPDEQRLEHGAELDAETIPNSTTAVATFESLTQSLCFRQKSGGGCAHTFVGEVVSLRAPACLRSELRLILTSLFSVLHFVSAQESRTILV